MLSRTPFVKVSAVRPRRCARRAPRRLLQLLGQGLRLLELLFELHRLRLHLANELRVPDRRLCRGSSCGPGRVGQQGDRGRGKEKCRERDEVLGAR